MDNKLNEIRKALESATPGKWQADDQDTAYSAEVFVYQDYIHTSIAGGMRTEDAHLIANSKEWISYLLSELGEADEQIQMWQKIAKNYFEQLDAAKRERNESLAKMAISEVDLRRELNTLKQDIEELIKERDMYADAMFKSNDENKQLQQQLNTQQASWNTQYDKTLVELSTVKQENADKEADNFILHGEIERLQQENERLRGALDELFKNREIWRDSHGQLAVENDSLQQQLKKSIEALEWYAHEETYELKICDENGSLPYTDVIEDRGRHAQQTLSLIREGESR